MTIQHHVAGRIRSIISAIVPIRYFSAVSTAVVHSRLDSDGNAHTRTHTLTKSSIAAVGTDRFQRLRISANYGKEAAGEREPVTMSTRKCYIIRDDGRGSSCRCRSALDDDDGER